MQHASPVVMLSALHCLHEHGGRRRQAEPSTVSKTWSTNKVSRLTKIQGVQGSSADRETRWVVRALRNSRNRGSSHPSHPPSRKPGLRHGITVGGIEQVLRT